MMINNCGLGVGYPYQPVQPESSAANGLGAAAGTGALALGTGTALSYFTNKGGFENTIKAAIPKAVSTPENARNVGRFQQFALATGDKLNHLGNFSKTFLGTKEGKIIAGAAAATAAIFGISKAWQADQHNQRLVGDLVTHNANVMEANTHLGNLAYSPTLDF